MSERIVDVNMLDQYRLDMQRYGLYASRARVLPEFKDGLKPVQRKILWAMAHDVKAINHTAKCAKIVGATIGNYSPHGDTATYGAMKSMINWFETGIPLLAGQGNFGNFNGDSMAAMRYTEASLNDFSNNYIFDELYQTKTVVDWSPNYSETTEEPDFLPAKVPLLLINGSFGIGLGFRVYIPRHNVSEVIDATLKLIENPDANITLIPECSMPCEIYDTDWVALCNKGRGSYKVRGIIDIEDYKGYKALVIKSLPDFVFTDNIKDDIEKLIASKKLVQIHDMFDESKNNKDFRFVIVLKKGADPNYVRDVIYKSTYMTKTFTVNFEVLDGINPKRMSYKSYLEAFIRFRMKTKFRLYCNKIQDLRTKVHERALYIKVLESGEIDNIIHKIRNQKTIDDNALIEYLIRTLKVSDLQAKFIINTNIGKLSMAYLKKYKQEAKETMAEVERLTKFTINDELILEEIAKELIEFKAKYGKRRTNRLIKDESSSDIPAGEFRVVVTSDNKIKKLQLNDPVNNRNSAPPKIARVVDNSKNIFFLDAMGRIFKFPVHKIPFTDRNSPGIDVRVLIKKLTSDIIALVYEPDLEDMLEKVNPHYAVVVSKKGYIKALTLEDIITAPASGIIYMKLDKGDHVVGFSWINDKHDVIVFSQNHALRLPITEIPLLKRNTKGLKVMGNTDEEIDGLTALPKSFAGDILVLTASCKVNRFSQLALPLSSRTKRGNRVIKLGKGDKIIALYAVTANDALVVNGSSSGTVTIPVAEIPQGSSVSTGIKLFSSRGNILLGSYIQPNSVK